MKKTAALCTLIVLAAAAASADMFILGTGRVLIGTLSAETESELRIARGETEEEVGRDAVAEIFRSDEIPENQRIVVTLADRSVIRGRLAEYDSELGLFIDIEYRVLNVPWDRIADVYTAESIAGRDNPVLSIYRMSDGAIIIGEPGPKTVFKQTVLGLSGEATVESNKIDRVDVGIESLQGEALEIMLRDHTVIFGEIVGYDAMLGYLVEISFGTLNIPPDQVRSIHASKRRGGDRGLLTYGLGFSFMKPVVSTPVQTAAGPEAAIQIRLPLFKGVSAGQNARYLFMNAPEYPSLKYFYASVALDGMVEFLPFFTKKDVRYPFSPYLILSLGAGIIGVVDTEYDDHQGGLEAVGAADLGVSINLRNLPSLRLALCVTSVAQDSGLFTLVGGRLSLMF